MMDGFDMRGLEVGRVYIVTDAMARYLIDNSYATNTAGNQRPTVDQAHDKAKRD